jgi:hypothetical protein
MPGTIEFEPVDVIDWDDKPSLNDDEGVVEEGTGLAGARLSGVVGGVCTTTVPTYP